MPKGPRPGAQDAWDKEEQEIKNAVVAFRKFNCPKKFKIYTHDRETAEFFYEYIKNCTSGNDQILYKVAFDMALEMTENRQIYVNKDITLVGSNEEHEVSFSKGELFGTLIYHEPTGDQKKRMRAEHNAFEELLNDKLEKEHGEENFEYGVKFDGVKGFIRETIQYLFQANVVAEDLLRKSNSPAGGYRRNTRRSRRGRRVTRKH